MVRWKKHHLCNECHHESDVFGCTGDDSLVIAAVFGFVFIFILIVFVSAAPDTHCGCLLKNGVYYCPT